MKILLSAAFLTAAILAANAGQATITSGPHDLTINAGSTADFVVTASNAKTYKWTFQGAGMLQATNIAGATKSEYKIDDTSTNQAGVYSVIVGSTGTNITNSATLNVIQGTIINFQISGFSSGPSNVLVELFDHDKPATVQNFLHYVTSIAYSNMFFSRLIPGFVLQGGDWFAEDQTNSTPPPTIGGIYQVYVQDLQVNNPPLPEQVASEFYSGPKVSNTKGTLAMTLLAGDPNSAANGFFFNLADNPKLDTTNTGSGPFTVFGRVLSGTNVLDYFNNPKAFSKPAFTKIPTRKVLITNDVVVTNYSTNRAPPHNITTNVVTNVVVTTEHVGINIFTNGIFDEIYLGPQDTTFEDLPVNFHGTNLPADSSLFFVEFSFPVAGAQPVLDTNPPISAITYPPAGAILTNGVSLTVRGTASNDVGLARVFCALYPANGAYFGLPIGANAFGTANWSLFFGQVEPGIYAIGETPQDGAGNLGAFSSQPLIITAVLTNGVGSVFATNLSNGEILGDAVGANMTNGAYYALDAQAGPGWLFLNWTSKTNFITIEPNFELLMSSGLAVTANFISNAIPGGIAFTYPPLQGNTTNGNFSIQGTINGLTNTPVTLKCQLFSFTNQSPASKVMQTTGKTNWSFAVSKLPLGHYYVQVVATDSAGQTTIITNDFTAGLPLTARLAGNGRGTLRANFTGQFLVEGQAYEMEATASSGSVFDTWSDGVNYTNNPLVKFIMRPGLVLTATFVSNDLPKTDSFAFTFPAPGAKLTNQTFDLAGTISSSVANPVVSYQLFYGSNSMTPPTTNVAILPGAPKSAWSAGLTNLAPGYYMVVATVSDATGQSALISEKFQILAQVRMQISPAGLGTVSSDWTGQYVSVGAPHTITAKATGGNVFGFWSNSAGGLYGNNTITFAATTNQTLTAWFGSNYFPNVAGAYYGLFYPTQPGSVISPTNSGFYSLLVKSNATLNLSLSFPGTNLTSTGIFPLYVSDPTGYTHAEFAWKGLGGQWVTNDVHLDMTNGAYSLYGLVAGAGFSSSLTAFRAATGLTSASAVIPGTNVFSIPGDHSGTNHVPGGDGYGALALGANGALNLIGRLADNTSFSQNTFVSTNFISTNFFFTNGIWPFYASLYGGKGLILGWQTNTSPTNFAGWAVWSKPALGSAFCTNAFLFPANSWSAGYIPPAQGTHYQISFGGGSLPNGLTNTLTAGANGLLTVDAVQPMDLALTLTNNLASGLLSGSFTSPSGASARNFYGAFVSPAQGGSGYFLDTNTQTGFFKIVAQ